MGKSKKVNDTEQNDNNQQEQLNSEQKNDNLQEIETLKQQISKQTEQINQLKDAHLRLMAEYDNFKKRTVREKENILFDATCSTLAKILPVMDSLKMAALAHTDDAAYKSGVELVLKSFDQALEKMNVVPIDALNKEFDPNIHNAVMHIEDETYGTNIIVEVLLDGYMMGEKVIRHAMVKVAN